MYVYDDGFVKGLIHIEKDEIAELYVDTFFESQEIGAFLIQRLPQGQQGKSPKAILYLHGGLQNVWKSEISIARAYMDCTGYDLCLVIALSPSGIPERRRAYAEQIRLILGA